MAKPLILVTNDDGINAPGIRTLISVMKDVGDIVVVAPDSPCLLYTSPSPRDLSTSRMPSSA